jgi:hypothetical protein
MYPIVPARVSQSLPMEAKTGALSQTETKLQESPPKRLSSNPVPTSGTPTFRPPRRITVHPFKYMPRRPVKDNQQARHQNSGRHDGKRKSGGDSDPSTRRWIVVHPLPYGGFRCCFTLSPKCFSSFAHATCALSVFPRYLALAEVYLPFALHSQAVLLRKSQGVVSRRGGKTGLSPSTALHSRKTFPTCGTTRNFILHNSGVTRFGLGFSLFARRY